MAPTSSPLSSAPSSQPLHRTTSVTAALRQYRKTQLLPFELAQHVNTYYEESLFTQAYGFLFSTVTNSVSASNPSAPVTIPSVANLALAATLAVHPVLTTRTSVREKWEQANAALKLLRLVFHTAGPLNADFHDAFSFKKYHSEPSRLFGKKPEDEDRDDFEDKLNTPYADQDSIWVRAEDFWQVVGWAFNCSCLPDMHAARWEYWEHWLEFMLEVLETDWQMHYHDQSSDESLIWNYVELAAGGHGSTRRILRAIFADGSTKSTNEFREIFHHELKEPVQQDSKFKKREVNVDIEAEVYGDYLVSDESDTSNEDFRPSKRVRTRTPSRRVTPRTSTSSLRSDYDAADNNDNTTSSATLGGPQSLRLRLRLLHLLSHIAGHPDLTMTSPTTFPDLDDLYTLFVEFIKPLPLSIFQQIASPSPSSPFSPDAHTTLCEVLLQRLLESAAPSVRSERFLTQRKLVIEYIPYAAGRNSVDANARVSLLLEALMRRLGVAGVLRDAPGLAEAVEEGVTRREELAEAAEKGRGKGRAKERDGSEEAWSWLVESGRRMRLMVQHLGT